MIRIAAKKEGGRLLRPLVTLHLLLAVLVPATYVFWVATSVEDTNAALVKALLGALGALWGAVVLIGGFLGESKDRILARAAGIYGGAIKKPAFLLISILFLAGLETWLLRQLLFMRSVQFSSQQAVELVLDDGSGNPRTIGRVDGGCGVTAGRFFSLPVGNHVIVARMIDGGEIVAQRRIEVPAPWARPVPMPRCFDEPVYKQMELLDGEPL